MKGFASRQGWRNVSGFVLSSSLLNIWQTQVEQEFREGNVVRISVIYTATLNIDDNMLQTTRVVDLEPFEGLWYVTDDRVSTE